MRPFELVSEGDARTTDDVTHPAGPYARRHEDVGVDDYIAPGTIIDDAYRVESIIGSGGMGVVALARDLHLARDVAIKFVHPNLVQLADARGRFLSEARAMARIRNAHVVHVYSFGEFRGRPYIVMEHVPGMSLDRFRAERGGNTLGVDEALGIIDQVCRGLGAVHSANALHRDLKPSNVLIGPAFRVVVADLGLTRAIAELVGTEASSSGTPAYMAPETLLGHTIAADLAPRADIYSLGVIAYELLTGKLPFAGTPEAIAAMLVEQRAPRAPSAVNRALPAAFDRPLLEALARHPENRTPTAELFRRALLAAADATRVDSSPVRILVADDDAEYSDLIAHVLARAFRGAVIECAPDGQTALEAAERRPPTLAVLDIDMPGLNGIETTASMRGNSALAHVPIIIASAVAGPTDWALLSRLGAEGFIGKPFEPAQLIALARGVLSQARRAR